MYPFWLERSSGTNRWMTWNKTMKYTFRSTPVRTLTDETGLHHCKTMLDALHFLLSLVGLTNTHREVDFLSAVNKTPHQQSGDWIPKWSFYMWMSVFFAFIRLQWGGGGGEGGGLISTVALSLVLFSPPSSSEQKKMLLVFPHLILSFFAYLWICMFASCSFLVVYVFCR